MAKSTGPFRILEATIDDIHSAYQSGHLTCRQLVQMYLDRIEAFDKKGPAINAIITISSRALEDADRIDAAYKTSGLVGTLHGIPVVLKDQVDAKGMPTTLGSVLFKNYYPDKDAFVVEKLKNAGAIILAKTTLGELGGGDTHGSLAVWINQKSIRVGSNGRRLFRRLRSKRVSKFCHGGCGTRGSGVYTQAIDVELNCGNADDGGACKP
jgi:Amidase